MQWLFSSQLKTSKNYLVFFFKLRVYNGIYQNDQRRVFRKWKILAINKNQVYEVQVGQIIKVNAHWQSSSRCYKLVVNVISEKHRCEVEEISKSSPVAVIKLNDCKKFVQEIDRIFVEIVAIQLEES
jgi:hypothetical protein